MRTDESRNSMPLFGEAVFIGNTGEFGLRQRIINRRNR
jgi:hypothetical protein